MITEGREGQLRLLLLRGEIPRAVAISISPPFNEIDQVVLSATAPVCPRPPDTQSRTKPSC
jgi:hypothetical protein